MKVQGVVWAGVRTGTFHETIAFFREVLGVPMVEARHDFAWSKMPNTSQLEIFALDEPNHTHFTTGPVPSFLVDDLRSALEELRAAGVEILGDPVFHETGGWLHFRAPDGNVYGLSADPSYRRP